MLVLILAGTAVPETFALPAAASGQEGGGTETAPPPLAIPPGYSYEAAGRRDPFINPVPPPEDTAPVIPEVRPPGLPGVLLNEARLLGVVRSPDPSMSIVLIAAPGNRTFVARPGDELYDVRIREIRANEVVFEVKPLDGSTGPADPDEVVRPIRPSPGE